MFLSCSGNNASNNNLKILLSYPTASQSEVGQYPNENI